MIRLKSKFSADVLMSRWDDYTSPARFAGCDDTMDLIFISHRKGNRVKLIRRASSAFEPFSCVFRGKIKQTEVGSEVEGLFTKSWFDYIFVAAIIGGLFFIRYSIIERGNSVDTINAIIAGSLVCGGLLLINTRKAKRRYVEFISRITDEESDLFLAKKEMKEE